jgi:hypothetical protein
MKTLWFSSFIFSSQLEVEDCRPGRQELPTPEVKHLGVGEMHPPACPFTVFGVLGHVSLCENDGKK